MFVEKLQIKNFFSSITLFISYNYGETSQKFQKNRINYEKLKKITLKIRTPNPVRKPLIKQKNIF